MLLIVTAQGLVALALAMQILHSTCLSLPVTPVAKAHWPMLPTVLLSQVLTGMQVYVQVQCMYSKALLYMLCTFIGLVCIEAGICGSICSYGLSLCDNGKSWKVKLT